MTNITIDLTRAKLSPTKFFTDSTFVYVTITTIVEEVSTTTTSLILRSEIPEVYDFVDKAPTVEEIVNAYNDLLEIVDISVTNNVFCGLPTEADEYFDMFMNRYNYYINLLNQQKNSIEEDTIKLNTQIVDNNNKIVAINGKLNDLI